NDIFATTFHGDMSQGARKEVLDQFKAKRWQLLITTDLAARGIDISQLPVVVNYDLPRSAADYIHRIGRTGRAGHTGLAITFVTPAETAHWNLICKRNALDLTLEQVAGFEPTEEVPPPPIAQDGNGGIKGKRPSKKDKLRAAAAAAKQHSAD
ncbi:MAG: C-terminal helicase domain-containing protein, partial [Comamonas sp.]